MNVVYGLLEKLHEDLEELGQRWALIGGIAVVVYAEARTTRDVDLVVAVNSDQAAESLVRDLKARGYSEELVLDHERTGRLAMIGLLPPGSAEEGLRADLLFSFSGIESDIVAAARKMEVLPGLSMPVARIGHLLALKVYSNRLQDQLDGQSLVQVADDDEIDLARSALQSIAKHNLVDRAELLERLKSWSERGTPKGI